MVKIHHLSAQVQLAAHFENATGVGEHLVEGQAQFIQVKAGGRYTGRQEGGSPSRKFNVSRPFVGRQRQQLGNSVAMAAGPARPWVAARPAAREW